MAADHSDDNDEVGYCKPPAHSRWKPGRCPNPRGRPKGALNFKTEVKLMLEAPVTVNDKGKPKKMTTLKASLWRVREGALKGNHRSLSKLLEYADRMHGGLANEPPVEISKDDKAILEAYQEEIRAEANKEDTGSVNDDGGDLK